MSEEDPAVVLLLDEVTEEVTSSVKRQKVALGGGVRIAPMVFTLSTDAVTVTPLDVADFRHRFAVIGGIVKRYNANAFLFLWDGWIDRNVAGQIARTDAILSVRMASTGYSVAQADPYSYTVFSGLLYQPAEFRPDIVGAYRDVWYHQ